MQIIDEGVRIDPPSSNARNIGRVAGRTLLFAFAFAAAFTVHERGKASMTAPAVGKRAR